MNPQGLQAEVGERRVERTVQTTSACHSQACFATFPPQTIFNLWVQQPIVICVKVCDQVNTTPVGEGDRLIIAQSAT